MTGIFNLLQTGVFVFIIVYLIAYTQSDPITIPIMFAALSGLVLGLTFFFYTIINGG